jgi:excisionase family DNA binding protein
MIFPLLTCKQASEYLNLPEGTIRHAVLTRTIPHYKLGRPGTKTPIRFSADELDQWQLGAEPAGLHPEMDDQVPDFADQLIEDIDLKEFIDRCKRLLPQREWDILVRRYGLEGHRPHTYDEIADEYHIYNRERIRQLEGQALKRLSDMTPSPPETTKPRLYIEPDVWAGTIRPMGMISVYYPKDAADAERFYERTRLKAEIRREQERLTPSDP